MKKGAKVIFRGDQHGRVIVGGQVSLKPSLSVNNVMLVDVSKHNLLVMVGVMLFTIKSSV